jgi:glycosyltransferase involved in cell wall biosynthesis
MPCVSIIIPALNEEKGIAQVVRDATKLELLGWEKEILVVDNGSTDRTRQIAGENGAHILYEHKRGYGAAIKTGFNNAQGDILVKLDADGTYPIKLLPHFLGVMEALELDALFTARVKRLGNGIPLLGGWGNAVITRLTQLTFGANAMFYDSQSGFYFFRRQAWKAIAPQLTCACDGFPFSQEVKIRLAHYSPLWLQFEIPYYPRNGKAKMKQFIHIWGLLYHLMRLRWQLR